MVRYGNFDTEFFLSKVSEYIEESFKDIKLSNIQKDLIYRICLESGNPPNDIITRKILLEQYCDLFLFSIGKKYATVVTYLLSHHLVEQNLKKLSYDKVTLPPRFMWGNSEFINYFISNLDINIVIQNPDLFYVYDFARHIKYPNEFIDNNFEKFLTQYCLDHELPIFTSIDIQKPSFDILVKHINEFSAPEHKLKTFLNEKQFNELKLLKKLLV